MIANDLHNALSATDRNLALLLLLALSCGGCATTSTLSQPVHERRPLVFSGARLDLASLGNESRIVERFGVSAPAYPLLDLPFSVFLDSTVLAYTVPVAIIHSW